MNQCVLAPHPHDDFLGCGGTTARRAQEGWHVDIELASSAGSANARGEVEARRDARFEDACAASNLLEAAPARLFPLPRVEA